MDTFAVLPLRSIDGFLSIPGDATRTLTLHDPALDAFTDVSAGPRITVHASDTAHEALALMRRAHVRLAFVDAPDGHLLGFVTADVLLGDAPARLAQADGGRVPGEVPVRALMEAVEHWRVVEYAQLGTARVGHVVATLHASGRRHLVVVQTRDDEHTLRGHRSELRGLFSASRIERALGRTIDAAPGPASFAELGAAIAHS